MRHSLILLVLIVPDPVQGQTPAPAKDLPPAELDRVLAAWEKGRAKMTYLSADIVRTRYIQGFDVTEVFEGSIKLLRSTTPDGPSRASLSLTMKGKPDVFEKYLYTGTHLYEFRPATKVIAVHDAKGGDAANPLVSLLFGKNAAELKRRYELSLAEDEYHHLITLRPRADQDKAEFSVARLALIKTSSLPGELWLRAPNGDQTTWRLLKLDPGAKLAAGDFLAPRLPPGWKWDHPK